VGVAKLQERGAAALQQTDSILLQRLEGRKKWFRKTQSTNVFLFFLKVIMLYFSISCTAERM